MRIVPPGDLSPVNAPQRRVHTGDKPPVDDPSNPDVTVHEGSRGTPSAFASLAAKRGSDYYCGRRGTSGFPNSQDAL